MVKLFNLFKKENREGGYHPSAVPPKWLGIETGIGGIAAEESSVKSIASAFRCINLLSNILGCLPLSVFFEESGKRKKATQDPVYQLLHSKPNRNMTSIVFLQTMMHNLVVSGNSYAQIVRAKNGKITELIPLKPSRMRVGIGDKGQILYVFSSTNGEIKFSPEQILHIKNVSNDGILGISPISEARKVFEMSIAVEEHGFNTFANGAAPKGVLKIPSALTKEKLNNIRRAWEDTYSGARNTAKTIILDEGADWKEISMSLADAEFLQQRKYQAKDICMIFGVPPHLIGDLERATFSNIEHQDLQFLKYTLLPYIRAFEQEINSKIFGQESIYNGFFAEFNVNAFARADQKGRYDAYAVGIQWGFLTRNEARALENLDLIDGLDDPLSPLNMTTINAKSQEDARQDIKSVAFLPIFEEIIARGNTKLNNQLLNKNKNKDDLIVEHKDYLFRTLRNATIAYAWQENNGVASNQKRAEALKSLKSWIDLDYNSEVEPERLAEILINRIKEDG